MSPNAAEEDIVSLEDAAVAEVPARGWSTFAAQITKKHAKKAAKKHAKKATKKAKAKTGRKAKASKVARGMRQTCVNLPPTLIRAVKVGARRKGVKPSAFMRDAIARAAGFKTAI
jgi:hypothetical protein